MGRKDNSGFGDGGFASFSDTASGGWSYYGSGEEQVEFFSNNSNYSELIDEMDSEDIAAFNRWTEGYFMDGAQYYGWDSMSDTEKKLTQIYDDYLDRATLDQGVVLVRSSDAQLVLGEGSRFGDLQQFQDMEGAIVTSKGCMSFGAASEGLTIGSSSKQVEYKLSIPKNTTGAGMWVGDHRINGWGPEQREFMVNRDTTFRVGKTTYDGNRDIFTVNLQYVGLQNHDYGTTGRVSYLNY